MSGKTKTKSKTVEETYVKKDPIQHIKDCPDTYVGSLELTEINLWTYDPENETMIQKDVNIIPGLYKIFDEILVNAYDHYVRTKGVANQEPVTMIKVNVDVENNMISVYNNGEGIPAVIHQEQKKYVPEMIFGDLLTSSNYDKNEKKITGGKNGYGAKACLRKGTLIPLFNGEIKKIEEIKLGEVIIGDDGTPRKVINKIEGYDKLFEVSQLKSNSYVVNQEHILCLKMPDHKVIFWNKTEMGWSILWLNKEENKINKKTIKAGIICPECNIELHGNLKRHYTRLHKDLEVPKFTRKGPTIEAPDTDEVKEAYIKMKEFADAIDDDNVLEISVKDYIKLNKTTKNRLNGYIGECVQWDEHPVKLDPYLLGLWLGDRGQNGYSFDINSKDDPEILEYIEKWCSNNDTQIKQIGKYSILSNYGKKNCNLFRKFLKEYNLIKNKHIPNDYLFNSKEVRLQLLAGLIDSDGYVTRDGTRIGIVQGMNHEKLAHQIIYLSRSLGFMTCYKICKTTWTYKGEKKEGKAIKINISGIGVEDIPTLVKRKKCSNPKKQNTSGTGSLTIKEIEPDEFVGLDVDGNKRFVLDDFTVTHNCAIFSSRFVVETVDAVNKKKYVQEFRDNLSIIDKPKITKSTVKPYTKITFYPDYKLLGNNEINKLNDDIVNLFHRRVLDMTACTDSSVTVYWNEQKINCKSFDKYVDMYIGSKSDVPRVYEVVNDRWEVIVSPSPDNNLEHISFVNGVYTFRGGEHVNYVANQIARKLNNHLKKKKGNKTELKESHLKDNMMLFLKCSIENPSFSSQTKEHMTTVVKNFGSKCVVSDQFIEKVAKTGIVERAQKLGEFKQSINLDKPTSSTKHRRKDIPKYKPANWAGGKHSKECILILTEGDSAASSAEAGFNIIGRDKTGVFPLRGKLLNVRDASLKQIAGNAEINYIREIMGLQFFKKGTKTKMVYDENLEGLNYGKIMIMCDQDLDGFHIKSLLINYIGHFWPSLLEVKGFITAFKTPIIVARKKSNKADRINFFNLQYYYDWKKIVNINQWNIKYYKGLGTSNRTDFMDYFRYFDDHYLEYSNEDGGAHEALNLAFAKKLADQRKEWLKEYDPNVVIDSSLKHITIQQQINQELKHFSNYDNHRNIPNMCDGLKPSQRKVMYYLLKKNKSKDEMKVAQLASSVASSTDYHHGETSMMDTIVNMGQDYMGSNNINLLHPEGQFGTRRMNGKDNASPRYIYTLLAPITRTIYRCEDLPLMKYLEDDNSKEIEPEWFLPILPMVLINGTEGIGTGYSTFVTLHNPMDIVKNIELLLEGKDAKELTPWFRGFKGEVRKEEDKFITCGKYQVLGNNQVEVTELPVGMSIQKYEEHLVSLVIDASEKNSAKKKRQCLIDFWDNSTDVKISFTLKFSPSKFKSLNTPEKLKDLLKMESSNQTKDTFMHLFDSEHQMKRYDDTLSILKEFFVIRLEYYQKRKDYLIGDYQRELDLIKEKIRFIELFISGEIKLVNQPDDVVLQSLEEHNFLKLNEMGANTEDDDTGIQGYNYLIGMAIRTLTQKRIEQLKKQREIKQLEYDTLEGKTKEQLWKDDLEEFKDAYNKMMNEWNIKMSDGTNGKVNETKGNKKFLKLKKI